MPDRLSLKYAGAALLFAFGVSFSSPAHAGFQWIAPGDNAAAPASSMPVPEAGSSAQVMTFSPSAPMAAPAPVAQSSAPEIISPIVISGTSSPAPAAPPLVAPVSSAPASVAPAPLPGADGETVSGFAKSVPLAVALRQILPKGYAFSIDQDVDMGTLVSFRGGRPWRETLRDMLAPAGLTMSEQGQMVSIGFAKNDIVAAPAPAPAPVIASAKASKKAVVYKAGRGPKSLAMAVDAPTPANPLPPLVADSVIMPVPDEAIHMDQPANANVTESWSAERGQRLRKVLEDWSRRANVEFDWLSEYDYPLQASVSFPGNFENAVRSLLTGFENAHPQPVAELHANPNMGQMVLVVRTRGNTNSD